MASIKTLITAYKQGMFVFPQGKQLPKSSTDSSVSIRIWRRTSCPVQVNVAAYMQMKLKSSPVTGLEWPRGFQAVKVIYLANNTK